MHTQEIATSLPEVRHMCQRLATDCGVACLAMLCGVSWMRARTAIFGAVKRQGFSTRTRDLVRGATVLGFRLDSRLRPCRGRGWADIPTPALVKVGNHTKTGWHWVVVANHDGTKSVFDPCMDDVLDVQHFETLTGLLPKAVAHFALFSQDEKIHNTDRISP